MPALTSSIALVPVPDSSSTQTRMADLAGFGARKLVDDLDPLRNHVTFEACQAMLDDIACDQRRTGAQCDIRLDGLAERRVGNPHHRTRGHRVEFGDHVLDLARRDLLAAAL